MAARDPGAAVVVAGKAGQETYLKIVPCLPYKTKEKNAHQTLRSTKIVLSPIVLPFPCVTVAELSAFSFSPQTSHLKPPRAKGEKRTMAGCAAPTYGRLFLGRKG